MDFKEQLQTDLDIVFFNSNEFAEMHCIHGKEVLIIVDNDRLEELERNRRMGGYEHEEQLFTDAIMFYVRKADLDFEPVPEQYLEYDGRSYLVKSVKKDDESYAVIMEANES